MKRVRVKSGCMFRDRDGKLFGPGTILELGPEEIERQDLALEVLPDDWPEGRVHGIGSRDVRHYVDRMIRDGETRGEE